MSRPEVYAALHRPLVQGYALDALEATEGEPPELSAARGFALLVSDAALAQRTAGIGLGEDIALPPMAPRALGSSTTAS